jgi:hypothetical protein
MERTMSTANADDPTPPRDPVPEAPPAPPTTTAFAEILWFLDQCRHRGYELGPTPIEHGGTRVQVRDLRQMAMEGRGTGPRPPGIWEAHGARREDDE